MKKLLKINFFILISLFFTILTFAQSSDFSTYKKFFEDSGFNFDTSKSKLESGKAEKGKEYTLIETFSQANNLFSESIEKLDYKLIFFVCNSEYLEKDIFSCNVDKFQNLKNENFKYESVLLKDPRSDEEVYINLIMNENNKIFILTEQDFTSVNKKNLLTTYFRGVKNALKVIDDFPNFNERTFKQQFLIFIESISFELFTYSIFSFIVIIFFGKLIIYLKNNYKKFKTDDFLNIIEEMLFGSFKNSKLEKILFSLLIFIYLIFLFHFFENFEGSNSLFNKVFFINLLNFNLFEETPNKNITNLIFYFLNLFFIFIFLISRFELTTYFIKNILSKLITKNYNINALKYIFITIYSFSILFLFNFVKNLSYEQAFYLIIFNLIIFYFISKENLNIFDIFTFREKIILITIVLVLFFGFVAYQFRPLTFSYKFENLIGSNSSIVALPYRKVASQNALFNQSDNYKNDFELYVDQYLVSSNKYEFIFNKNIKNFIENSSPFIVVSESYISILKELLLNQELISSLPEGKRSNIFYFSKNGYFNNLTLNIEVNCSYKNKSNFVIKNYYYNYQNKYTFNEYFLGNIIGCNSENKVYTFRYPKSFIANSGVFFEFKDLNPDFIKSFTIVESDKSENTLLKRIEIMHSLYYFVASEESNNYKEIYNYFIDGKNEYNFESNKKIENINILRRANSIKSDFNIWSLDPLKLIINEFDSK